MTTPLDTYNDPALRDAVFDVIAALPDEHRQAAADAYFDTRISIVSSIEPGLDGTPMLVLDVAYLDDNGSQTLARFDGRRFGFYAEPDGSISHGGPER